MRFDPRYANPTSSDPFVSIPRGQRYLITAVVVGYCLLITALNLFFEGSPFDRAILLVSSLCLIITTALPMLINLKNSGFLHPLVLSSGLAFATMAIRQTDQLATGLEFHVILGNLSDSALTRLVAYVNMLGCIALLAQYAGYFSIGSATIPLMGFRRRPNNLFTVLLLAWLLLGILSMYGIIRASGGLNAHFINMNKGAAAKVFEQETMLLGAFAFLVNSTVVIPIVYAGFSKKGHRSPIFFTLAAIVIVLAYIAAGRRSAVLAPIYMILAMWIYKERKLPLLRIVLIGFALFLFVAIGSVWRSANRRGTSDVNWNFLTGYTVQDLAEISMQELSDRSGRSAAIYPIAERVPKDVPFNYGQSYLENFYRFIPRAIWPEKPRGVGITCAEVFYNRYNRGGIPPGALGEAYWSGHIIGIIVVFGLFGMFLRVVGNTYMANPQSIGIVILYLLTLMRLNPDQVSFRVWIFIMVPTIIFCVLTGLLTLKGLEDN